MPIKFPPPPFLTGKQFQTLNRWLLDVQSVLSVSGLIDPSSVDTLPATTAQVATNTANIATINGEITTLNSEVTALQAQYSFGTWTPSLQGSTLGGTPTYTIQSGTWEKVGRMVTARFSVATSALGGPTGSMQISGLPFTSVNSANDNGGCTIHFMSGVTLDAGYVTLTGSVAPNTSLVALQELGSGHAGQPTGVGVFAAATTLEGVVHYRTP
jgi:hypothetical protein